MRILIVAAHPDDEVLGCGGIISRASQEGHDIYIAILGEGITSRYKQRHEADTGLVESLREKARKVADFLGARDAYFNDLPDNRFDTVPLLDITKIVENLIERIKPRVIYTHHAGDLNIDHTVVHRAVITAARPLPNSFVKTIYSFEVPSSSEWSFGQIERPFSPNVFVDISATIEKKLKAMEIYESETRPFPHPRSSEALLSVARRWGSAVGCEAAEAFELIRDVC